MRRTDRDQDGVFERWKIATFAKFQLLLKIAGEIVVARELDRRTERRVGLHENFSLRFTATGPSRHLSQQLKRSFARAEIRKVQREIGVDDSDQGHVRKMQTFRDHLRADKNVDLAGAKTSQIFAISVFARHRISVHPSHRRFRKKLRDSALDLFRPESRVNERVFSALRTFLRDRGRMSAKVTAQSGHVSMKGQSDAAVGTIARFAAITA